MNKSEKLSEEKIAEFRMTFKERDKDGDNFLDISELSELVRSLNQTPTQDEIIKWTKQVDPKNKGKFDFQAFLKLMLTQYKEPDTQDQLIECMQTVFKPKDETIGIKEFKNVMMNLGQKLSEEEVRELFKELKLEKETNFNYEEFIRNILTR